MSKQGLKDEQDAAHGWSLKQTPVLTLDWGGALIVQMQSRASPGFTRSSSSTWLERITPSHPLISNWQSEKRQGKCGVKVRGAKRKGRKCRVRQKKSYKGAKEAERSRKKGQQTETGRWGILFKEVKDLGWKWNEHRGLEMRTIRSQKNKGRETGRREQDRCVCMHPFVFLNFCMFCQHTSFHFMYIWVCVKACSAFTSDSEISSGKLRHTEELFKRDRTQDRRHHSEELTWDGV